VRSRFLRELSNSPVLSDRRRFVTGLSTVAALSALGVAGAVPWVAAALTQDLAVLRGTRFDLHIGHQRVNFTGKERVATNDARDARRLKL
jgi:hypothetical protein